MSNNKQIIFWGTPNFALPSLEVLHKLNLVKAVVTQADKPAGRNKNLSSSPVKDYAVKNNLALLQPDRLDNTFGDQLAEFLPATFVIVAYGKIIPQEFLNLSELPAINIHPSALPKLRGPSPIQTAILEGFDTTAVTLMQLDRQMDHGSILGQIQAKIEPNDDYFSLSKRLSEVSAKLLQDNIANYLLKRLTPQNQDHGQATFCQLIKKADGQINWVQPVEKINNQIRAFVDWPGSFTKLGELEVKIIKAQLAEETLNPSQTFTRDNRLFIGTQTKALEILELQPAGKNKMTAEEFIRGYNKYL